MKRAEFRAGSRQGIGTLGDLLLRAGHERKRRIARAGSSAACARPLPKNGIVPHYQPIVSLKENRIIAFEMLARWDSPDFGPVSPETFISIAEETGIIKELGDRLLRQAARDAAVAGRHRSGGQSVASPVARSDLRPAHAVDSGRGRLSPRRLEIEITESAIVRDIDIARKIIDELRDAGVRVALDDFGPATPRCRSSSRCASTRSSSIADSSAGSAGTPTARVIVRTILGLAQNLGLSSTAEGIEDAAQLKDLTAMGCLEGQGYYFSRAVPSEQVLPLLRGIKPTTATA